MGDQEGWVLHHLIQHETEHRGQIMEIQQQILAASTFDKVTK